MDRQKLQATLQDIKTNAAVRVAFVLDKDGALVAWAGKSAGFSPVAQFPSRQADEEPVNLYLTTIGSFYVGILFSDGDQVDLVRGVVDGESSRLKASLGIPEEGAA